MFGGEESGDEFEIFNSILSFTYRKRVMLHAVVLQREWCWSKIDIIYDMMLKFLDAAEGLENTPEAEWPRESSQLVTRILFSWWKVIGFGTVAYFVII